MGSPWVIPLIYLLHSVAVVFGILWILGMENLWLPLGILAAGAGVMGLRGRDERPSRG